MSTDSQAHRNKREAVARAICNVDEQNGGGCWDYLLVNFPKSIEAYFEKADAVIALRRPADQGLVKACEDAIFKYVEIDDEGIDRPVYLDKESVKRVAAFILSLPSTRTAEWMPIETAPKDGTLVDLRCEHPDGADCAPIRLTDCAWRTANDVFPHTGWVRIVDDGNWDLIEGPPTCTLGLPAWQPTHWMRAPELRTPVPSLRDGEGV